MIIFLNTQFNDDEKEILNSYINQCNVEMSIVYSIASNKLKGISSPNRIIFIGGLYLCEEKDELLSWHMGQMVGDTYDFWGNYGGLKNALEGL